VGSDYFFYLFLEFGGVGGIFVYMYFVVVRVKELVRFYKDGDVDVVCVVDEELKLVIDVLVVMINLILVKVVLNMFGYEVGGLCFLFVEVSE